MPDTAPPSPGNGAGWGRPAERRETTQQELRAHARERVRQSAARGEAPSRFVADDLRWAFGDTPEALVELEELEALAERVRAEKVEKHGRLRASEKVRSLAALIIKQQDKEAADARMAAAIAEARRRLGEPEPQTQKENR